MTNAILRGAVSSVVIEGSESSLVAVAAAEALRAGIVGIARAIGAKTSTNENDSHMRPIKAR
jgi:hypothetical protein